MSKHQKTMDILGLLVGPYRGKKEGNSPRSDELVGDLIRFLESQGLEVYPMQNGGYQVKGNQETVRFYISRLEG